MFQQYNTRLNHEYNVQKRLNLHMQGSILYLTTQVVTHNYISNIFKITILSSTASSSSIKLIKCPHTNNYNIFAHNCLIILSSRIKCNAHTDKDEHNA